MEYLLLSVCLEDGRVLQAQLLRYALDRPVVVEHGHLVLDLLLMGFDRSGGINYASETGKHSYRQRVEVIDHVVLIAPGCPGKSG